MSTAPAELQTHQNAEASWLSRHNLLWIYAALVAASIAFDFSVYLDQVHVYLHDITALVIGVVGTVLAVRNRAVMVGGSWFIVPLALLVFVVTNTVLVGALHYGAVPADMRKLFWFEHGDAIRITGELFACVWAFGQLRPSHQERWAILDVVVWGAAFAVGLTVVQSIVTNTAHDTTTSFDVDILAGFALAVVFALRMRARSTDFLRLLVFGAGSSLLYSRATMLVISLTTVVLLVAARNWRKVRVTIASIAAGWLIVLFVPLILFGSTLAFITLLRAASIGETQLAPYTFPNRIAIWRDALRMSERSPIIGVGYHDYFLYSSVTEIKNNGQLNPPDLFSSRIKSAHNDYLSWLSETGVLGLLVFVGLWGTALARAIRFLLRSERDDRLYYTYAAAFIVSILCISVFGEVLIPRTPDAVGPAMIWWIVLASLFIDAGREGVCAGP